MQQGKINMYELTHHIHSGLSTQEIADLMGVSRNGIYQAKKRLKNTSIQKTDPSKSNQEGEHIMANPTENALEIDESDEEWNNIINEAMKNIKEESDEHTHSPKEAEFECQKCDTPIHKHQERCSNCGVKLNWQNL